MNELILVVSLFAPLLVGIVFHGLCIKFGWLTVLAFPIDRGARFRGREIFGPHKTFRGVFAVALGTAVGYVMQGGSPSLQPPGLRGLSPAGLALLGLAIGGASMLSELPNSFLKRQLRIPPGAPGRGPAAPAFYVLDQVDFLLGAWLVAWPWVSPRWPLVLWSVAFFLVAHQLVSALGALLGMRANAR